MLNRSSQTVAVLGTFIRAMVLYPDVLAKAQDKLDQIIGSNRLPDLSDRDTLPYIDAIITETMWYVPFNILALHSFHITEGGTHLFLWVGSNHINPYLIYELRNDRCAPQGNAR